MKVLMKPGMAVLDRLTTRGRMRGAVQSFKLGAAR